MNFILKYHEKKFHNTQWVLGCHRTPKKKACTSKKLMLIGAATLHGGKNMCGKAPSNSPAKFQQGLYVFPYILI